MNKKGTGILFRNAIDPFSFDDLGGNGCAVRSRVLGKVSKTEIKEMVYKL
jgi:hypothetical protein